MGQIHDIPLPGLLGDAPVTLHAALVHRIPLRDRFRVPGLRGEPELAAELCRQLRTRPGIRGVRANPTARSLVVDYADAATQEGVASLLAALPTAALILRDHVGAGGERPRRAAAGNQARAAAAARKPRGGDRAVAPATAAESDQGWHLREIEAVLRLLQSQPGGLDAAEVMRRLQRDGPNLLQKLQRRSDWNILLEQFQSAPVAMLGVSAAVALLSAAPLDAAVIAVVVGANAAIGFLTERQAEDTIASLARIEGQRVRVLRAGAEVTIDAAEVVRGDILLLEPGTRLPADARLVKAHHLTVDESSLTGESLPVVKRAEDCPEQRTLADRRNMVHLGTIVSGGDGRAVVVETGDATELGRIQALASSSQQPMTPMQRQLSGVSTQLALFSAGICALVFVAGLLRGQPRLMMLNTAISLAVAAVPEGLPAISNSLLAIGIRRMRSQNVLARRLEAIENLGAIDVLCIDKTGTLTENRMQVVQALAPGADVDFTVDEATCREQAAAFDKRFWQVLALCNDSRPEGGGFSGSPTENALLEAVIRAGLDVERLRRSMPRQKVRYRSESRPYMATLNPYPRKQGWFLAVKGRPRQVLARCTHLRRGGRRVALTDAMRDRILAQNSALMDASYRVLGVAWAHREEEKLGKVQGLEWLGLVAMTDPLRPEVMDLLPRLQDAGIRTIILTGDQRGTAAAIGRKLRLNGNGDVRVLGADELEELSEEALHESVKRTHVFARVSPAMKLKLVRALQDSGHRVAMTGDGVNDGPALRVADVGIAMGRSGSDVARSMSDVVLTDDRLQSIIDAMAHGRASFANLQKAIEYLLSTNFSEIEVMLTAILTGLPNPLTPIQLLWINLMTDVFPSLAIGFESPEWDVLRQPPDDFQRGIIDARRLRGLLGQSLVITGTTMGSYLYGLLRYGPGQRAGTQAFMTLTTAQLMQALSSRSRSSTIFRRRGTPPNPWLQAAVAGSLGLQAATALPGLRRIFGVSRPGALDLLVILGGAVIPLLLNEGVKELWLSRMEREQSAEKESGEAGDG
jgi:Ca2+-transporting ATPase